MAFTNGAHATGGGGIIACPAGNDNAGAHAPFGSKISLERPALFRAFDQGRHMAFGEPRRIEQAFRPCALAGIEPGGPGRIRHFGNMLTGQPQAKVILGQQDPIDLLENIGFVFSHPGEFRGCKTWKDNIASQRPELRIGVQRQGLLVAARIVPENARAQHLVIVIQKRRAVHMTGEADALDGGQFLGMSGFQPGDRLFRGADPIGRVLFRPARMRPRYVHCSRCGTDDPLAAVDQQCLHPGRTEVDAKIHDDLPSLACPQRASGCCPARTAGYP